MESGCGPGGGHDNRRGRGRGAALVHGNFVIIVSIIIEDSFVVPCHGHHSARCLTWRKEGGFRKTF